MDDDGTPAGLDQESARPQPGVHSDPYRYRGLGLRVVLVIGVVLTVLALVLAVQNTENTTVEVFTAEYRAPLVVVVLIAALAGAILGAIFGFVWRHQRRRRQAEHAELRHLRRTR